MTHNKRKVLLSITASFCAIVFIATLLFAQDQNSNKYHYKPPDYTLKKVRKVHAREMKSKMQEINNCIPHVTPKEEKWMNNERKRINDLGKVYQFNSDFVYSIPNMKARSKRWLKNYIGILNIIISEDDVSVEMFYWSGLLKNYRMHSRYLEEYITNLLRKEVMQVDVDNHGNFPFWYELSVTAVIGPVHDHANRASLCALNGAT